MNQYIRNRRRSYIESSLRSDYINDPDDLWYSDCYICERNSDKCKWSLPYPKFTRFLYDKNHHYRICLECYLSIRCDTTLCNYCHEKFFSNNELYKHLMILNHYM